MSIEVILLGHKSKVKAKENEHFRIRSKVLKRANGKGCSIKHCPGMYVVSRLKISKMKFPALRTC